MGKKARRPRRGRSQLSGCEQRECAKVLALSKGDLPPVSALGFPFFRADRRLSSHKVIERAREKEFLGDTPEPALPISCFHHVLCNLMNRPMPHSKALRTVDTHRRGMRARAVVVGTTAGSQRSGTRSTRVELHGFRREQLLRQSSLQRLQRTRRERFCKKKKTAADSGKGTGAAEVARKSLELQL